LRGLKLRETNIIKIVKDSISRLSLQNNIDIRIKSSLDDEKLWVDHEEIVTAFFDLEQNAVEAMPDGGKLTIMVEGDERHVFINMTDEGSGIAEENIPLLFMPFFTTKPAGEGTGLGLPQAYAAIKAHNGDICIESNADPEKGPTGTTIRISLPRRLVFQEKEAKLILHDE
jgi:signal transduction histidine kinase